MAGGVHRAQRDALAQLQHVTIGQHVVGLEGGVLPLGIVGDPAVAGRAGGGDDGRGGG